MAEKERIFYKVTNRNLARYFKNPADSNKLGKIVETGLLQNSKFANDTIENFLIKLGLCNNDMSAMVYIPCIPTIQTIIKVNNNYKTYDTIIGITNSLLDNYPYHDDDYSFGFVFTKKQNTGYYDNTQFISTLVGYYIDKYGNNSIVTHHNKFYSKQNEYLDNVIILHKWNNKRYNTDSLLTVDGNLIPKENYAETYERYIGKAEY